MKNAIKYVLIAIASLFVCASCQIGLGPSVDIEGPSLTVNSPAPTSIMQRDILVSGTATDNEGVTQMTVTLTAENFTTMQFMWNGTWKVLQNGTWAEYPQGQSSGDARNITWSLSFVIPENIAKKEFTLITEARDKDNNPNKNSKDERIFTVDGVEPEATVSIGNALYANYAAASQLFNKPENELLQNNEILDKLVNQNFTVKVNQKENTRLGKFILVFDEVMGTDESADIQVASMEAVPDLLSLSHVYTKVIDSSTRSFEINVEKASLPQSVQAGKHLLKVITESFDEGGNLERKVQGYFVYYNESDKPWTQMTLGDTEYKEEGQKIVYPGCLVQGYAYDDDGVQSVDIEIYVRDDSGNFNKDESKSVHLDLTEDEFPKNKIWSVYAISEVRSFYIKSWCTDIYGAQSTPFVRYLKIASVNPPELTITSPQNGSIVLGDASSKFTITVKVRTQSQVRSFKIVRIANKNKDDYLNYMNTGYPGWNTETDGNKLWVVGFTNNPDLVDGSRTYIFAKEFNIISDFGINGTGTKTVAIGDIGQKEVTVAQDNSTENIKSQLFILRIEDDNGAITEELNLQGDVEKPALTINAVYVVHMDGSPETVIDLTNADNNRTTLQSYKRDAMNRITDKVYYTGTWNDNLVTQWNDTFKIGKLYLYNSNGIIQEISVAGSTKAGDVYTWQSEAKTPEDTTTVNINALITDWGANTAKTSARYFVSSCPPALLRINSTKQDGTYKKGDQIPIVMEYNKKVTFEGVSADPYIILNNDGVAKYVSGNGGTKHTYLYTVGKGLDGSDARPEESSISEKLYVRSLVANGNTWKDTDGETITDPTILTGYNLNQVRSIYIDNANPRLLKVESVTGTGYYNAGKELYFQAAFNKDVTIADLTKVKLTLNIAGAGKTQSIAQAVSMPNAKALMFKYTIADGDKADRLEFVSFDGGQNNILDVADNAMTDFTPKEGKEDIKNSSIVIDTAVPAKPAVTGITNGTLYYSDIETIAFTGFESAESATRYYSFDGGTSWTVYTDSVTPKIAQNGTYKVCAKQIDKAGNQSPVSDVVQVSLDKGNLLTSITTKEADGTYKAGQTLHFVLTFRKSVKASGIKLNLGNIGNGGGDTGTVKYAGLAAPAETAANKIEFTYTITEDDATSQLNAVSLDYDAGAYIKDEHGTIVAQNSSSPNVIFSDIAALTTSRDIKIVNGKPVITKVELVKPSGDGAGTKDRELRITFNTEITKQSKDASGNDLYIVLKQASGFEAPAILTESQYQEYGSTITDFYKETTNGWDTGTQMPDLSTKYVLKYEYDTDNTDLVNALKAIYNETQHNVSPDTVPVAMASNYVKVDDTGNNVLVVSLKDDFALPVQGADYTVTIPAGVVENNIQNKNDAAEYPKTNTGVETPVIRVNKVNETIDGTTVIQHPTTTYKADCQTPGCTINLRIKESTPDYLRLSNNGGDDVIMKRNGTAIDSAPDFGIGINDLENDGTIAKKAQKTIGTPIDANGNAESIKGYKILIEAKAKKGSDVSEPAYESAMRTVVVFYENGISNNATSDYPKRWLRGGDNISGGVTTADFPLTWDSSDWNKSPRHVRAMSPWQNNGNVWYWITWNINATSYVHFLAGDMPDDANEKGPAKWWWSSCGWANMKTSTPVYAGECSYFDTNANSKYGGYSYLYANNGGNEYNGDKHREHR